MSDDCFAPEDESEPYETIVFYCQRSDGTITEHRANCGTNIAIQGLKTDMQNIFNIPTQNQVWEFRNQVLQDNETLEILRDICPGSDNIKIAVKSSV
nr:hypothetical protein BgiMline_031100 [Biomphalaria glabrata]